jgi:hypothetical protein
MKSSKRIMFLIVVALALLCLESDQKARAVQSPPWLKECVYDSNGNLVFYTCNYIESDLACAVSNC